MDKCKHCGESIESTKGSRWTHVTGRHQARARCSPEDSGLHYGYNADPTGTPCSPNCIGAADVEDVE